ncbi:MAG: CHAP domain-containing protein [Candidatus Berkelbacteria bacterium]
MLIHEENEPPISNQSEKTKNTVLVSKIKNYLQKYPFIRSSYIYLLKLIASTGVVLSHILSYLERFSAPKNLPHIAIVAIFLVVFISNTGDRLTAMAYVDELTTVAPDEQFGIIQSVDAYTPLTKDDAAAVDKSLSVAVLASGFDAPSKSVETNITAREEPLPDNSASDIYYIIRNGDTLTSLSVKFGVKLSTIKYVNDIDNINLVKPGSKIKISRRGYEVSAAAIAKKEAEKTAKLAATKSSSVRSSSKVLAITRPAGAKNNNYPYGWCTYYVATQRFVPAQWGNAKYWLQSAARAGYATGSKPVAGAIYVSTRGWGGHVAYVEEVYGDGSYKISEMNGYAGWGRIGSRVVGAGDASGFIY